MYQKIKRMCCYALIIVLLPYIVTVFLSGPVAVSSSDVEKTEIRVMTDEGQANLSIQEYGIGILAKVIPVTYEEEALKAQAILVRTNLYKTLEAEGSEGVLKEEFWDREEMEEAWGQTGFSANYRKMEKVWEETNGQVIMYEGSLAYTPFFRLSNGSTRDGKEVLGEEYPYLKIVDCPLDIEAVEQIQTITIDDMDAEILATDTAGYVLRVRVGNEEIQGEEFRRNYHLASGCFSFQKYEGKMRITTRGEGHGIGLSQHTANEMAKRKKTYEEILQFFYTGTKIEEVADIIRNTDFAASEKVIGENMIFFRRKGISASQSGKNIVRGGDENERRT